MSGSLRTVIYVLALVLALLLQFVVLPGWLAPARPLGVPLVLAAWVMNAPGLPALPVAFIVGLCLDVLLNCVLGQHALGLLLLTYIVARLQPTLVMVPRIQATLALAPLWAGYAVLMGLFDELTHHVASPALRWWPLLPTTLLWPLVDSLLQSFDQRRSTRDS